MAVTRISHEPGEAMSAQHRVGLRGGGQEVWGGTGGSDRGWDMIGGGGGVYQRLRTERDGSLTPCLCLPVKG